MIIINCFFLIKVIATVKKLINQESDKEMVDRVTYKLKWYPIIQIICFVPATINRVYDYLTGNESFILTLIQAIFDYSSGFLFAIVYGLNHTIIDYLRDCLSICFCCKKKKENDKSFIETDSRKSFYNDKSMENQNLSFISIDQK